jgi:hypothetical protein
MPLNTLSGTGSGFESPAEKPLQKSPCKKAPAELDHGFGGIVSIGFRYWPNSIGFKVVGFGVEWNMVLNTLAVLLV